MLHCTNRELYSSVHIKGSSVKSGRIGRLSLALDATGIARHRAVALVHLLAIFTRHRFHDNKIYSRVSTSANLNLSIILSEPTHPRSLAKKCRKTFSTSTSQGFKLAYSISDTLLAKNTIKLLGIEEVHHNGKKIDKPTPTTPLCVATPQTQPMIFGTAIPHVQHKNKKLNPELSIRHAIGET